MHAVLFTKADLDAHVSAALVKAYLDDDQDGTVDSPGLDRIRRRASVYVIGALGGVFPSLSTLVMEAPIEAGTTPPNIGITGTPKSLGYRLVVDIVGAGALGVATFRWSVDDGATWSATAATAATAELTGTGLTVTFPDVTYAADNEWRSAASYPSELKGLALEAAHFMLARRHPEVARDRWVDLKKALDAEIQQIVEANRIAGESPPDPVADPASSEDVLAGGAFVMTEPRRGW
jgi:hypothetical protein